MHINQMRPSSTFAGIETPKLSFKPSRCTAQTIRNVASVENASSTSASAADDPLLLRALRGDAVERPPVWMMRQAGRYMKVYQDLCKKHTTFRERSENVDIAVEVSLQPWRAFRPDGVILFSDILTPIAGMNIPFDITAGKGPVIFDPIRTMKQVDAITQLNPEESVPFVGEALRQLRAEVGNDAAVLGFVGAPFTLATYIVEGGMSKSYTQIKTLMFTQPEVLHGLLQKLADAVVTYIKYQADAGAQTVQIFDSWAAQLSPEDFDVFSGPYLRYIIKKAKEQCPDLPIILYISNSGALVERMAACGPDIISLCHTVDMKEGIERAGGSKFAYQGNMDPGVLFGSKEAIEKRTVETARAARDAGVRHIVNLGHGVLQGTPEENVRHFFEVSKTVHQRW